jgi:hypothetical protein
MRRSLWNYGWKRRRTLEAELAMREDSLLTPGRGEERSTDER